MARPPIAVRCPGCEHEFVAVPKLSFLGFPRVTCPQCGDRVTAPLGPRYRSFYTLAAGLMAASAVGSLLTTGHVMLPGLAGAAMIGAIVKDALIRRELRRLPPPRPATASGLSPADPPAPALPRSESDRP